MWLKDELLGARTTLTCLWCAPGGNWFSVLFPSCHWGSGGGSGRNSLQVLTESSPVHLFPTYIGTDSVLDTWKEYCEKVSDRQLVESAEPVSLSCLRKGVSQFPWKFSLTIPPLFCLLNLWLTKWPLDTPCLPRVTVSLLGPLSLHLTQV